MTREEAIELLKDVIGFVEDNQGRDYDTAFRMAIEALSQPTGRWIKAIGMMPPEFHGHHYCSECGNFANMKPPFGNREDLSNFCPNCRALMLREDGEAE